MPNPERTSSELTEFEIRWNPRSFWWNVLVLFVLFLVYTTTAALASGSYRLLGVAGGILFGVMVPYAGLAGAKQLRRRPMAVALNEFGVTLDRHDPVAWETIREVHLGRVRPHLLFFLHPLNYVAFLPKQASDPHSLTASHRGNT